MKKTHWTLILSLALVNTLSCNGSDSSGGTTSGTGVSGSCTYIAPALSSNSESTAALCYTYSNIPVNAATGGMGLCPTGGNSGQVTVGTVSSCPATLSILNASLQTVAAAQLGTCTITVPAAGSLYASYSYTIVYYAGENTPTCSDAHTGCETVGYNGQYGYSFSWAGVGGCQ